MTTEPKKNEEEVCDASDTPKEEPVTCDICDKADEMAAPFLTAITEIRKQLQLIRKSVSSLRIEAIKPHPKCGKCGVFFGGTHSGGMLPVPQAQRGMCRGCAKKHLGLKFSVDTD